MGKTLLSKALIRECGQNQFRFVVISNPRLSPVDLLKEIQYQLSGSDGFSSMDKVDLLHAISRSLQDNFDSGFYTALVVDEAQSIAQEDFLEELRLLLNIQRDDSFLFTLLLLGQSSILENISRSPQLKQRFSIRYYLHPFDSIQTARYIAHRLNVAGLDRAIFTEPAYSQIYELSGGIPRIINNICDLALLTGFIKHLDIIDKEIIIQAEKDLEECFCKQVGEKGDG